MKPDSQINNLTRMESIRESYLTPQVEVFEIKVEQGFAASGTTGVTIDNWGNGIPW